MSTRLLVYDLIDRYCRNQPGQARALYELAGLERQPDSLVFWALHILAVTAAFLAGFGLILFIAANWDSLSRLAQFALLQSWVITAGLAAWRFQTLRTPFAILALLGIGALFAYFGQTYQTGADPWQLFALWACLGLPLALAARHDAYWIPWFLVVFTAVILWGYAQSPFIWLFGHWNPTHLLTLDSILLLLSASFHPNFRRFSGASIWSFRWAMLVTLGFMTVAAIANLFVDHISVIYWPTLLLIPAIAFLVTRKNGFDIVTFANCLLAFDALLVFGLIHILTEWIEINIKLTLACTALFIMTLTIISAKILLALIRSRQQDRLATTETAPSPPSPAQTFLETAVENGLLPAKAGLPQKSNRPWPVTLLTVVGSGFTLLPIISLAVFLLDGHLARFVFGFILLA